MIGVKSYAEKALDAVERNRAAVARSERRIAEHDASRPEGDDADALFNWKREQRDLVDRLEADREALVWSEAKAAEAAVEAAERKADAEYAAEEKAVRADEKLVRQIDDLARKLADARDALAASVARTDAVNTKRGDRPFIVDAETRVRSIPGKVTPAIKETRKVWVGTDGKPCSEYTVDAEGRQVKREGIHEEMREFVIRGELPAVATMPTRFADALVLVDIAGRSL